MNLSVQKHPFWPKYNLLFKIAYTPGWAPTYSLPFFSIFSFPIQFSRVCPRCDCSMPSIPDTKLQPKSIWKARIQTRRHALRSVGWRWRKTWSRNLQPPPLQSSKPTRPPSPRSFSIIMASEISIYWFPFSYFRIWTKSPRCGCLRQLACLLSIWIHPRQF